ncbi:MAG: hypothetical protein ACOX3B_01065 [Bacilli bacterium]|jgi:hypothetical protein|nr:hypothetical protein [Bacillota bacterium]NLI52267.1 cbb3-type cytochrome c oxidase subunit I [Erysipelotrichaceae bacterium]OQC50304.1 MAG: hypothetical protein BWX57_00304 [Tenericutes bacterium ADurb.Bin024]HOA10898.1 hypothetical protein [Bacilli bacterium]TAH59314.1 MAG: hypothetical protein EWM49_00970 [Bacillota bacterium]
MARKKKNDVALYDDSSYEEDDLKYAADEEVYAESLEDDEGKAKKKRKKKKKEPKDPKERKDGSETRGGKTLTDRYHYRGRYYLLPERELRKQLRFYQKVFNYRFLGIIAGVIALIFSILSLTFNAYFAVFTLLIVITGLIYGLLGMLKLRGLNWLFVLIGIGLNIMAIVLAMKPLTFVFKHLGEIMALINEYMSSAGS